MRPRRTSALLVGAAVLGAHVAASAAPDLDARALGLGGSGMLHQLAVSPGAPIGAGFAVQCGAQLEYVGSGLGTQCVGVQRVSAHHAWALGAIQEKSDIHTRTRLRLALQTGNASWRCGIGVGVSTHRFTRYAPWRTVDLRLGIGMRWRERLRFAGRGEREDDGRPRLGVAFGWQLPGRLLGVVQLDREPGEAIRARTGCVWGEDTRLAFLAGFDVASGGASGGVVAALASWRLTYSTQSHPELGWSHAWMLEFRR